MIAQKTVISTRLSRRPLLCLLLAILLAMPGETRGQDPRNPGPNPRERALGEIEAALAESDRLVDAMAYVEVRAKASNLVWLSDRDRARSLFRDLWTWVADRPDGEIDIDAARTAILKHLSPRDPKMAARLLESITGTRKAGPGASLDEVAGTDPNIRRLARLSSEMASHDSSAAAELLQRALSISVSPPALVSLFRLRDSNPVLADYIAAQTLESLKSRTIPVALFGLNALLEYIFPSTQTFSESFFEPPDPSLRARYFTTAYEVLKESFQGDDTTRGRPAGSPAAEAIKRRYRARLAGILAVLAPEYGPDFATELTATASRLASGLPPDIQQSYQLTLARLAPAHRPENQDPETAESLEAAISLAMARGEMAEARRLLDRVRDEALKTSLADMLAHVEFKDRMRRAELAEALIIARKLSDANISSSMFAQVAKAAYDKGEVELSKLIVAEARSLLLKAECNGLQTRALLSLAAEASAIAVSESIELLGAAASCLNYVARGGGRDSGHVHEALAEMNAPASLLGEPWLHRAFSTAGAADLDAALLAANAIEDKGLALVARLGACEGALGAASEKRPDRRRKPATGEKSPRYAR